MTTPIWIASRRMIWVALLLIASGASAQDGGDGLEQARQTGTATLQVLWVASPGWAERRSDGQINGVTIELMRRFAQWLGEEHDLMVELEFVEEENWSHFYRRVRDARSGVFGLGNVTITEARQTELQFSPPYARNTGVLISSADVPELTRGESLPDLLHGRRAMAFADTLHEQRLRSLAEAYWPAMAMDFTGSNDEILAAVADGTHFAYIDGYHYLRAVQSGAPLRRHPLFDDADERFGVIMPLSNDWSSLLERFFKTADGGLLRSGWYQDLLEQHLGQPTAHLMRLQPDN